MSTTPILESIHDGSRGQLKVKAQACGRRYAVMRKVKPTGPLKIVVRPIAKHQSRRLAKPREGPRKDSMATHDHTWVSGRAQSFIGHRRSILSHPTLLVKSCLALAKICKMHYMQWHLFACAKE